MLLFIMILFLCFYLLRAHLPWLISKFFAFIPIQLCERLYGKISLLIVIGCLIKVLILRNILIHKKFNVRPYS